MRNNKTENLNGFNSAIHSTVRSMILQGLPGMIHEKVREIRPDLDVESVKAEEIEKNNGTVLIGIHMYLTGMNIAPCIYVEPYLPSDLSVLIRNPELYRDTTGNGSGLVWGADENWDRLAERMSRDFCYAVDTLEPQERELFLSEDIPEHLIVTLKNWKMNRGRMKEYPCRKYLDLVIAMEWEVVVGDRHGSVRIPQEIFDVWGKSFEELYPEALEQTIRKYPGRIEKLEKVIRNIGGCSLTLEESPFYYYGTEFGLGGAVSLLYPEMRREMYEQIGEPFYLIPSSINELLALPVSKSPGEEYLKELVHQVNEEVVDPMEVLSDSLYLYRPEEQDFLMI